MIISIPIRLFMTLLTGIALLPFSDLQAGPPKGMGGCPPLKQPLHFQFSYTEIDPVFDTSKPRLWITRQMGGNPMTRAQTQSSFQSRISGKFSTKTNHNTGMRCVYLTHVKVLIEGKLTVYIGREFVKNRCAFNNLREHEKLHVAIWQEKVRKYLPDMREAIHKEARMIRPVMTKGKSEEIFKRITDRLTNRMRTIRIAMNREEQREQKALDTPQSYRALERKCKPNDW